ncbi:DUF1440 domain-containing protein [Galbibacter sp. EGI 63066]|uniref:DUF1440 domain-containing protein n=1 Tax=Galbibacter sp. EGI 63066 TaxID=2993559 RepID=UPI002248DA4A|nr:DUF1440 domain-containing protein [Galbibacter sp. EGI 63066]MCX2679772.1 DUF1440 domain-containing protein [Galbibacter sp. EGI 63066]
MKIIMNQTNWIKTENKKLPLKKLGITALVVGTADIMAAIFNFLIQGGEHISGIFRFIASGVFGQAAFERGSPMIFMGGLFHYLIAFLWTALFFYFYPKLKLRKVNVYFIGSVYGVIVWSIMNLIVLPLSNTPELSNTYTQDIIGMVILILCVGFPVSLMYKKYTG